LSSFWPNVALNDQAAVKESSFESDGVDEDHNGGKAATWDQINSMVKKPTKKASKRKQQYLAQHKSKQRVNNHLRGVIQADDDKANRDIQVVTTEQTSYELNKQLTKLYLEK
jgi:hypothetical protein